MRVLLLSPTSVPGGAERAFAGLARQLPALGFEPRAVLLQSGPLEGWLAEAGCPVEVIDAGRTRHLHRTAATIARVALRAHEADVVVSNQSKGHVYGGLAALLVGRPAVWWQHGTPERSPIELTAAQVPASVVIAGSKGSLEAQRRLTSRCRIELVQPGIDVKAVRARRGSGGEIRRDRAIGSALFVGIVGRLQEWKGQDVFLRAAAIVAESHPTAIFFVVGGAVLGWEGDYPCELHRLATELAIEHKVHFVGHQDDVYPWFDALDVVVHASFGEPFGLVLLEAMALGKPIVATADGGPLEIIEDGVSGILVPPGDGDEMAGAITKLLDDERLRVELAANASVRADRFDERRMAERFGQILNELREHSDSGIIGSSVASGQMAPQPMAGELTHEVAATLVTDAPARGMVLDAGAGQGAFSMLLRNRGFQVVAAGIKPQHFGIPMDYVACDLDASLPFLDHSLEGIVAIELIEHLESPLTFVRDCARCLVPGGWLIISTPNILSLASKLSFAVRDVPICFGEREYSTNGHISPVSVVELERIGSRCGLAIDAIQYSVGKIPVPKLRHRVPLRSEFFRRKAFGESVIVSLRKVGLPAKEIVRG